MTREERSLSRLSVAVNDFSLAWNIEQIGTSCVQVRVDPVHMAGALVVFVDVTRPLASCQAQ